MSPHKTSGATNYHCSYMSTDLEQPYDTFQGMHAHAVAHISRCQITALGQRGRHGPATAPCWPLFKFDMIVKS